MALNISSYLYTTEGNNGNLQFRSIVQRGPRGLI